MHIAKLFRSVPFHNITVNIVKNKFTKKNQYASIFKILCATCTKKSRLNIVMTGKYMNVFIKQNYCHQNHIHKAANIFLHKNGTCSRRTLTSLKNL